MAVILPLKTYILVEKTLYPIPDKLPSKIKDTNDMLDIIDCTSESALTDNHILVCFDVVSIVPKY